jgi:hypothetical protein
MSIKYVPQLVPNAVCLAKYVHTRSKYCLFVDTNGDRRAQLNAVNLPLFRLPAEIRNQIYGLVMDTDYQHLLHEDCFDWDRLSLSRTSRQLFAETAQDYFDNKLRDFANSGVLLAEPGSNKVLITKLTPSQKSMITRVIVHLDCFPLTDSSFINLLPGKDYRFSSTLEKLPNLQHIVIESEGWPDSYGVIWTVKKQIRKALKDRDVEVTHKDKCEGGIQLEYEWEYEWRKGVRDVLE